MEQPQGATTEISPDTPLRMTYDEFLLWANEETRAEWVDGEVILLMLPQVIHQVIVDFLLCVLGIFVHTFNLGEIYTSPIEVRADPDGASREPDLVYVAQAHSDRVTPERISGPPDLIIEVVSDDSVSRDRVDKFDEYEAAPVPEYWIIDNRPGRHQAYFYQLAPTGAYQRVLIEEDGIYRSAVLPGFWLRVSWLWQERPSPLEAIAEMSGLKNLSQTLREALEHPDNQP